MFFKIILVPLRRDPLIVYSLKTGYESPSLIFKYDVLKLKEILFLVSSFGSSKEENNKSVLNFNQSKSIL